LATENAEFDLGHVEPTAVLGREVKLQAIENAPRLGWLEYFV
jgi:hypothetical protein